MLRKALIAFSLANLCYLRIWSELLTYTRENTYFMPVPPRPVEYVAVMANVVLLGAVFLGLFLLAARFLPPRFYRLAEIVFLVSLLLPLNGLRGILANRFPYLKSPLLNVIGLKGLAALVLVFALASLWILAYRQKIIVRITTALLVTLSPFCAVTFAEAAWKIAHYDARRFANNPPAPLLANAKRSPRAVWFICDEWDYRLTFADRDPSLRLPETDRLRKASFFAENAYPPGHGTPVSVPGYYTGRLVKRVLALGPHELRMRYAGDSQDRPWSEQPNVFERAREAGFNTALLEWFHPTCRVLDGLSFCEWWPMAMQYSSMGDSFWEVLPHQTRSLFETNLFSLFGRSLTYDQQTEVYQAMLRDGERVSDNALYGFTVVHLPIPHPPYPYDRRTGRFDLGNSPYRGYLDNLALLDVTIGDFRRSMEAAGTWDSSAVLFTSDHPYRESESLDGKSDPRIPFILKLPGQKEGVVYAQPFNTVLSGELLLEVLRGQVNDAAAASAWMDRNRGRFPLE